MHKNKKKILISITSQFGYHTDTYMYCKYLDKSKYDIHYVGFDSGLAKRSIDSINIHYIPVHKNKIKRYLIYIKSINSLIRKENFDLLFIVDCQGSLLIRLGNLFRKSILDIRTGDVNARNRKLSIFNYKILFTSLFFKRISIISKSLAIKLNIPARKIYLLPLGGETEFFKKRTFSTLKMFYIGTLQNRHIHKTIKGLSIFLTQNPSIKADYNIVGFGSDEVETDIKDSIIKYQMESIVKFHGRKNHNEVEDLFNNSNLGVVYVPITDGYNSQPTTKLFEYTLAGMPVIITSTIENKLALKKGTGILVQDNAEAFAEGLEKSWKKKNEYLSNDIRMKYTSNTWEKVVNEQLEPLFKQILNY